MLRLYIVSVIKSFMKAGSHMYKKRLLKIILTLISPPFISFLIHLLWGFPILLVTSILYFLLFLLNIPVGEDLLSTFIDYQNKKENPYFKVEKLYSPKKLHFF